MSRVRKSLICASGVAWTMMVPIGIALEETGTRNAAAWSFMAFLGVALVAAVALGVVGIWRNL